MIKVAGTTLCMPACGLLPWWPRQQSISSQEDACLHGTGLSTVNYEHANRPATFQTCLAAGEALLAPVRVEPPLPLLEEGTSELVR